MVPEKSNFEKALAVDEDELYAIIGYQMSDELGGAMPSFAVLIHRGKEWYEKNSELLRQYVCNSNLIKKAASENDFSVELCVIIADYLVDKKIDAPIVPIAALIVRKGIKNMCHDTL